MYRFLLHRLLRFIFTYIFHPIYPAHEGFTHSILQLSYTILNLFFKVSLMILSGWCFGQNYLQCSVCENFNLRYCIRLLRALELKNSKAKRKGNMQTNASSIIFTFLRSKNSMKHSPSSTKSCLLSNEVVLLHILAKEE